MLLLLSLACEPQPPSATRAALQQLEVGDQATAEGCDATPEQEGECRFFLARAAMKRGEDAADICAGINAGSWRDACWFERADRMAVTGPEAAEACAQAGRHQESCLQHARQRQVEALLDQAVVGQEPGLLLALEPLAGRDSELLLAAALAARVPAERGLWAEDCGAAPLSACWMAWRVLAQWRMADSPCQAPELGPELGPAPLDPCASGPRAALARDLGRWRMRRRQPGAPFGRYSPLTGDPPSGDPPPGE